MIVNDTLFFDDGGALKPVALGLYPFWDGPDAHPQDYHSPVAGNVRFQNIDVVKGAKLGGAVSEDGRTFVIAAAFPRSAFPSVAEPFSGSTRTRLNFSANLGGHNKFWWANIDGSANIETYDEPSEARLYPGSWAPAVFGGLSDGVPARQWLVCGPFGGPGCEGFAYDLGHGAKDECIRMLAPREYPPDGGKVDPEAVYSGDIVKGYWGDPGQVRWHVRGIEGMDSRVAFGPAAQVWYAATWVHTPEDVTLEALYLISMQVTPQWFVNGQPVEDLPFREIPQNDFIGGATAGARVPISLKAGWNQIFCRGFCVGFPPMKMGLRLYGDESLLWPLSFSATPPDTH